MLYFLIISTFFLTSYALPRISTNRGLGHRSAGDPVIPTGWSALGCYTDSVNSRTLKVASTTSLNLMTLSSCISFCSNNFGLFTYAGVEFGRECSIALIFILLLDCDNTINPPGVQADDSGCNVPCTGDSTQNCGGADHIFIAIRAGGSTTTTTSAPPTSTTTPIGTPTPSIKQNVGTWQYMGCHVDFGDRILQHQLSIPTKSVEACVAACGSSGYGLAGLEFGGECWCDVYLPFGDLHPDSECSMTCGNDPTELCGAGNRLALYQNNAATPPSTSACLPAQLPGQPFVPRSMNTALVSVDFHTGGNPLQIYGATPDVTHGDTGPEYSVFSHCRNCPFEDTYSFFMTPSSISMPALGAIALAPRVGESPLVVAFSSFAPYTGYCAQPNPISPTGPFIGAAVLAADGRSDLFSLCTNTTAGGRADLVYSPIAGHPHYDLSGCTQVYIQFIPFTSMPLN